MSALSEVVTVAVVLMLGVIATIAAVNYDRCATSPTVLSELVWKFENCQDPLNVPLQLK
jgi:hypothetical protein